MRAESAVEYERKLVRQALHPPGDWLWRGRYECSGHLIEQTYNFALAEAVIRARVGLESV